ncbi:hypothetical protein C427_4991 [Paraglaciecola psychrophila 170]|uniref:Uncharacterized protein n=1 Tax=Paraglaciecola psychrophila 170 TaxID=1129794 RepID=K7AHS9_9ALTE|nr:hypothetical protein C427_4991 [Paraglaciecola psychrophila 170]GAC40158.1 hypothetical protein GPSY_4555 [Paraglaciecola psychrophila 170]
MLFIERRLDVQCNNKNIQNEAALIPLQLTMELCPMKNVDKSFYRINQLGQLGQLGVINKHLY